MAFGYVAPPSVEYARSMFATPVLSVAVHVMLNGEPTASASPPFGAVTVTEGAWLSYGTVAAAPGAAASAWLLQSRSETVVTVRLPVPPGPVAVTPTLNRFPVRPVAPQF